MFCKNAVSVQLSLSIILRVKITNSFRGKTPWSAWDQTDLDICHLQKVALCPNWLESSLSPDPFFVFLFSFLFVRDTNLAHPIKNCSLHSLV